MLNTLRTTVGLATAAAALCLTPSPAMASSATPASAESGLTFYADNFTTPVANYPNPDGECTPFPASAVALVGWSNVTDVIAYRSTDCSGQATGLGTLRTFTAGEFVSFRAS
jgi:hypothetical protein